MSISKDDLDTINVLNNQATPFVKSCIVTLWRKSKTTIFSRIGNATAIIINSDIFLLTCAHVIDEARNKSGLVEDLWIRPLNNPDMCEELVDISIYGTPKEDFVDRELDPLDIAIIKLNDHLSELLVDNIQPIPLFMVTNEPLSCPSGYYFFLGFPGSGPVFSWKKLRRVERIVSFGSDLYNGNLGRAELYHPLFHLEINFDGKGFLINDWSKNHNLPDIAGVSGSPLFLLYDYSDSFKKWHIGKVLLVGLVQSLDLKTKSLRAVRISYFLHLIGKIASHLTSEIGIHMDTVERINAQLIKGEPFNVIQEIQS